MGHTRQWWASYEDETTCLFSSITKSQSKTGSRRLVKLSTISKSCTEQPLLLFLPALWLALRSSCCRCRLFSARLGLCVELRALGRGACLGHAGLYLHTPGPSSRPLCALCCH